MRISSRFQLRFAPFRARSFLENVERLFRRSGSTWGCRWWRRDWRKFTQLKKRKQSGKIILSRFTNQLDVQYLCKLRCFSQFLHTFSRSSVLICSARISSLTIAVFTRDGSVSRFSCGSDAVCSGVGAFFPFFARSERPQKQTSDVINVLTTCV